MGFLRRCALFAAVFTASVGIRPADAIPFFAHEYALACQKCHSVIPRLTDFGEAFREHGYHLPGATPQRVFPVAGKINLAYSGEHDDTGLPKAVVDEVELFVAGTASSRTSYFVEQYVVDGGRPGSTRDAWVAQRLSGDGARAPVTLQAGSFTLPLPVDPESFRETAQHYAVFDQAVGTNPFTFFAPKVGVQVRVGTTRGLSAHVLALQGHDPQSGVPTIGTDVMATLSQAFGPATISAYRYAGTRPDGNAVNRFVRQGVGLTYATGRWTSETVLQTGRDGSIDGAGTAGDSSGGFTQLRYEFNRRAFALVRYEGTNDPTNGVRRDFVALAGYRVTRNSRLTAEDAITHVPFTKHAFTTQYTVAY